MIATSRKRRNMATAAKVVLSAAAVILVVRSGEIPPDRTDPGCACYRGDAHRAGGWRTLPGWMLINRVLRAEVARAQVPSAELTAEEVVRPPLWPDPPLTVRPYWGLSFDGTDDYATAPNSPSLNITGSLTIEAWVNPSALAADANDISGRWGGTGQSQYLFRLGSSGKVAAFLSSDGTTVAGRKSSAVIASIGIPVHVATVYDATAQTLLLYVNGGGVSADLIGTIPASLYSQSKILGVGASYIEGGAGGFFSGRITQLRVWNVARTQAQIQSTMYRPFLGPTTGLVLEYPMLPGTGQTITDHSGTGNHGTRGSTADTDTNDPQWTGPYRGLAGGPLQ